VFSKKILWTINLWVEQIIFSVYWRWCNKNLSEDIWRKNEVMNYWIWYVFAKGKRLGIYWWYLRPTKVGPYAYRSRACIMQQVVFYKSFYATHDWSHKAWRVVSSDELVSDVCVSSLTYASKQNRTQQLQWIKKSSSSSEKENQTDNRFPVNTKQNLRSVSFLRMKANRCSNVS
jgi:hypothetical protein